jgi:hypothetical protein
MFQVQLAQLGSFHLPLREPVLSWVAVMLFQRYIFKAGVASERHVQRLHFSHDGAFNSIQFFRQMILVVAIQKI